MKYLRVFHEKNLDNSDTIVCDIKNTSSKAQTVHVDFGGYDEYGSFDGSQPITIPAGISKKLMLSSLGREYKKIPIHLTMLWAKQPNDEVLTLEISQGNLGQSFTISDSKIEKNQHNEHVVSSGPAC